MKLRTALCLPLVTSLCGWLLVGCTGGIESACEGIDCSDHGFCVAQDGVPACQCINGYMPVEGPDCALEGSDNPCFGVLCSGHGSCLAVGDEAACACEAGYAAQGLECVRVDPCDGIDCSGHGTCRDDGSGAPICDCLQGYHLVGSTVCEEDAPDPCAGVLCSGNGTCQVAAGGAAECACDQGYHAEGLSCAADDPCEGVVCGAYAQCDGGDCFCLEGYEGDAYSACTPIDQTAAQIRAELVAIAEAELGMCEGRDVRPYMEAQPGYWCYDFVMWVYAECSEPLPQPIRLPQVDPDVQPAGWNPKPGDLIKYDIQHYGMVKEISADGSRVITLEGNVNRCVMGRSTTHASVEYYGVLEQQLGD